MTPAFPVVECENVSKTYELAVGRKFLRTHLSLLLKGRKPEVFHALTNISFVIEPGESLAIVGANGAGKSTLLSLVAGVSFPSEGRLTVNGKVAAMLELGSGFHPDLTGRENVMLNGALLGLRRKELLERFSAILEFSGIEKFIDQPLRTYSSGMIMRLAFSVAVHVDPDLLVIDEAFAVGDQQFHQKCIDRIFGFKKARKSFVCVSHVPELLRELCEHAIWLDRGQVVMKGNTPEVLEAYRSGSRSAVVTA
jgi:ABC-type polysaccharide/polyol phosphate transport system ATPase subunit